MIEKIKFWYLEFKIKFLGILIKIIKKMEELGFYYF